jgi:hypothetical protein
MRIEPSDPDIETLYKRIHRGRLDLQPDFQRGEVWGMLKKQRLIDTILRNWHVPPIHVVEKAGSVNEVLDGQQRLAAIRDFIDGVFPVNGEIEPASKAIQVLDGLFWTDLPDSIKDDFNSHTIRVLAIHDHLPEEAAEMFFRLNQPANLTAPEQRNAYFGVAREQVKGLVSYMVEYNIDKEAIGFTNARMAYDDVLSKVLVSLEVKTLTFKVTSAIVANKYRSGEGFSNENIELVSKSLAFLARAIRASKRLHRQNKATLYSWILFYCEIIHKIENHLEQFLEPYSIEFFEKFHSGEGGVRSDEMVTLMYNNFHDRSQSRVADTASVRLRDFCIWGIFWKYYLYEYDLSDTSLKPVEDFFEMYEQEIEEEIISPLTAVEELKWGGLLQ